MLTADITTLNVTGSINGNSNYPLIDQFRMGKYVETFNDLGNKSGTVNLNTSTLTTSESDSRVIPLSTLPVFL